MVVNYGYNYRCSGGELIFRYDNSNDPQARQLRTFPHHKHTRTGVSEAAEVVLDEVLDEISRYISL
jgi:hypothetical protein